MGLFKMLFGPSKAQLEEQQRVALEQFDAEVKAEQVKKDAEAARLAKLAESRLPKKTDAEIALDKFSGELVSAGSSVEKARDTLYDQKAQLAARYNGIYALEAEIEQLRVEMADVERVYATAVAEEKANLEIKGQKLQNTISRKETQMKSEKESLGTFKATIDVLERTVENSEAELNNKRSNLAAARTAVAVIELNEDIKDNLANDRMAVLDNNSLDVFFEKQKLLLNDIENEVVVSPVAMGSEYALPFKSRMVEGELVEDGQAEKVTAIH